MGVRDKVTATTVTVFCYKVHYSCVKYFIFNKKQAKFLSAHPTKQSKPVRCVEGKASKCQTA